MLCHIGQCQRATIGTLFGVNFAFSKNAPILKKSGAQRPLPILRRNFCDILKWKARAVGGPQDRVREGIGEDCSFLNLGISTEKSFENERKGEERERHREKKTETEKERHKQ
jgi:hypothetical protein